MKVVVVGGGHNGLVCAAHVAAAGVEVTVLEHAPRAGGAVASHAHGETSSLRCSRAATASCAPR